MQNTIDLNEIALQIRNMLDEEYNTSVVTSVIGHQKTEARRSQISMLIEDLTSAIGAIQSEYNALPQLATLRHVERARAITKMDLTFLEIDTTGLGSQDEVCRILLLNKYGGEIMKDIIIKPGVPNDADHHNGLRDDDLREAPTFPEVYERIVEALEGRYIVSYGLRFDEDALNKTCAKYQLPSITLIGCDLQRIAMDYWNNNSIKLEQAADKVGFELPAKPNQTAYDRARAQYRVLCSMAQAVYNVHNLPLPPLESSLANEDLDDHPF